VELPDIKTLGTYDATVKLHPEVVGTFKVVVQKLKEQK
jgi:large subunit ribosomal protein L9